MDNLLTEPRLDRTKVAAYKKGAALSDVLYRLSIYVYEPRSSASEIRFVYFVYFVYFLYLCFLN